MDSALEASARFSHRGKVQTIGPLIHNPQALEILALSGVIEAGGHEDIDGGTVIIRAHGIPLNGLRHLRLLRKTKGLRVYNATCPEVGRVQSYIRKFDAKQYFTIILGHENHPEVIAHKSYAHHGYAVLKTVEEALALPSKHLEKALVVAQTTFGSSDFDEIVAALRRRNKNIHIKRTICADTLKRQAEAERLVSRVDGVVVVGGLSSNNTIHLADLARRSGKVVQHVETADKLDINSLSKLETVGVLAGASTPTWIVKEVVGNLANEFSQRSKWRVTTQFLRSIQMPQAVAVLLATWVLHTLLRLERSFLDTFGPCLTILACHALAPFLDSRGLATKGGMKAKFLHDHRFKYHGIALACILPMGIGALVAGAGPSFFLAGFFLAFILFARAHQWKDQPWAPRRIPCVNDLVQALAAPVLMLGWPLILGQKLSIGDLSLAGITLFCWSFAFNSFRHFNEFRNDWIISRETLVMAIGRRGSLLVMGCTVCLGILGIACMVGMASH